MLANRLSLLLALLGVTALGYVTYFENYEQPPHFFWDENYHVAHAQKYLNGVFFMEPHPPLGKLLIALGEEIVGANERNDQFIGTDHAKNIPSGFSFRGYRLIPTLLAWAAAPLFLLLLYLLTSNILISLAGSLFYLFDNALIVHSRSAMLEGPQIFFVIATLVCFACLRRADLSRRSVLLLSALFGICLACVVTIKINGLILVVLIPALFCLLLPDMRRFMVTLAVTAVSFSAVFITVWQIHFSLAKSINPQLPDQGYYQASEPYKAILASGEVSSIVNFPLMVRDHLRFVRHYEKGVPRLNYCNQEENGSPFFLWPLGGRTIDYRWEKKNKLTRYLYLVPNPAVWWLSFLGLLVAASMLIGSFLLPITRAPKNLGIIATFLSMYAGYMLVMGMITRVMYLYHYFIPLIFSMLLFAVVVDSITSIGRVVVGNLLKGLFLCATTGAVLYGFNLMSPFSYYKPLSNDEVRERNLLSVWDLRCPHANDPSCAYSNRIAVPVCDPKVKPHPDIAISGLRAESGVQDWGEPHQGATVESQALSIAGRIFTSGFGVHANSSFRFSLQGRYGTFSGLVGVPDAVMEKSGSRGSVRFEIYGDGAPLWRSEIMHAGEAAREFSVSVRGMQNLELRVSDGGDGIDNDHACWLDPRLES